MDVLRVIDQRAAGMKAKPLVFTNTAVPRVACGGYAVTTGCSSRAPRILEVLEVVPWAVLVSSAIIENEGLAC